MKVRDVPRSGKLGKTVAYEGRYGFITGWKTAASTNQATAGSSSLPELESNLTQRHIAAEAQPARREEGRWRREKTRSFRHLALAQAILANMSEVAGPQYKASLRPGGRWLKIPVLREIRV
jgi:hypothetical protein